MSKMVIAIIAPASVLSISITCFILKEVIRRHDEEIVKVIASDVYDNIGNELVNAVMLSRGMANDTFLHQNLRAEDSFTVRRRNENCHGVVEHIARPIELQFGVFGFRKFAALLDDKRACQATRSRK